MKPAFLLPSPIPISLLSIPRKFFIPYPTSRTRRLREGFPSKCSLEDKEESSTNLKDALSGLVDEQVEQLLNREENRDLLDGLEKASLRVEMAKRRLAEIERQELEAKRLRDYVDQLERRASEIAECQKEILEARAKIDEAERSLSSRDQGENRSGENEEIDRNAERIESIKAASVSALTGTLAGLPISLAQVTNSSQFLLPLAIAFISSGLFGVTFRYAVRRDLDNIQLKTGVSAAFGFVKGLGMLASGPPLEMNPGSFVTHAFDGALYISENLYIFLSAAIALDYCIKMKLLSPFPIKR